MEVTPLELGLAALAVCITFGPKALPGRKKVTQAETRVDLSSIRTGAPSNYAAGRAPSPLSMEHAPPVSTPQKRQVISEPEYQYSQPSKLPYEF